MTVLVVGGGVIGLACASAISRTGTRVILIESSNRLASETSSRNSGVIHAGIYYKPGSLKAELCRVGSEMLYRYCKENQINYNKIGKLIVATTSRELDLMEKIQLNAANNGVGLADLTAKEVNAMEPHLSTAGGLYSPNTGIVDVHSLVSHLEAVTLAKDAEIFTATTLMELAPSAEGFTAKLTLGDAGGDAVSLDVSHVVNAAGHNALSILQAVLHSPGAGFLYRVPVFYQGISNHAHDASVSPAPLPASTHFCQGRYMIYRGASPVSRLIYPAPEPGTAGLGIHATLDLGGSLRFGPDVGGWGNRTACRRGCMKSGRRRRR